MQARYEAGVREAAEKAGMSATLDLLITIAKGRELKYEDEGDGRMVCAWSNLVINLTQARNELKEDIEAAMSQPRRLEDVNRMLKGYSDAIQEVD